MRVWRVQSIHRLAWIMIALLVLAVAIFVMATGFSRLRSEASSAGAGAGFWDAESGRGVAALERPRIAGSVVDLPPMDPPITAGCTRF